MKRTLSPPAVVAGLLLLCRGVLAGPEVPMAQASSRTSRVAQASSGTSRVAQADPMAPRAQTPDEPPPAPPPSVVDQVLQQILVERDLEQAHRLLTETLVQALNQVDNPAWTARVYALLSAISMLGGDEEQARRLSLRAVALDPAVRLEPQLGEGPLAVLSTARKGWLARDESAVVSFLELPPNIQVFLDGKELATPGSRLVREGDHLVQVKGSTGVLARAWITVEAGAEVVEPPPMEELRRVLNPSEPQPAISAEELEQLMDTAQRAQTELRDVATDIELDLTTARAARQLERVACLAEQDKTVRRLLRAADDYTRELQWALDRDHADDVRHLFRMVGLTRDEAVRLRAAVDRCFDRPERGAETEVRVIQAPPAPPPEPVRLENGASSRETRPPLAAVPEAAPRHTMLRPPPVDLWSREAAPRPSATAKPPPKVPWLRGDVWLEAAYDTNPQRAATARRLEPAAWMLLTPTLALEGAAGSLRARYPLRLGTTSSQFTDFELVGQARLSRPDAGGVGGMQAGLELRRDTFRVDALGDLGGEMVRTAGRVRVDGSARLSSALELELDGEGLVERYDRLESGVEVLRLSGSAGVAGFWRVYPFSVVVGELVAGGGDLSRLNPGLETSVPDFGTRAWWYLRARAGFDGRVAAGLTLSLRAGYQPFVIDSPAGSGAVGAGRSLVGSGRIRWDRKHLRLWLEAERTLAPVFFADAALFQGVVVGLESGGGGTLRARALVRAGVEELLNPDLEAGAASIESPWAAQPSLGGELSVRYRLGSLERLPLHLSGAWMPSIRGGLPAEEAAGTFDPVRTLVVHQLFLGASLEW